MPPRSKPGAGASVYASGVQHARWGQLGSRWRVTDSSGGGVASNDFYPYGTPAATTGLQASWFSGYEFERQNTASTYADVPCLWHARWYFAPVTRFLSPDPLRGDVFSPQSLNLFAYVGGNPTNFVDRWGLMASGAVGGGKQFQERDGNCAGDNPEDPDCPRFSEEVTVTANAIWAGGRFNLGVPWPWIEGVQLYADRYVAGDTFFGRAGVANDLGLGASLRRFFNTIAANSDVGASLNLWYLNTTASFDQYGWDRGFLSSLAVNETLSLFNVGADLRVAVFSSDRVRLRNDLMGIEFGIPPVFPWSVEVLSEKRGGRFAGLVVHFGVGSYLPPALTHYPAFPHLR